MSQLDKTDLAFGYLDWKSVPLKGMLKPIDQSFFSFLYTKYERAYALSASLHMHAYTT